jgi:hypothetical protein
MCVRRRRKVAHVFSRLPTHDRILIEICTQLLKNCEGLLIEKGAFTQQFTTEQIAHQNTKISDAQTKTRSIS